MIHGQIRQLFPGQLAEIQIGEQKMIAKLEVPMRAGESYYFQVTSISPEVQLKIISGPTDSGVDAGRQLQSLMQAMQLPKSLEMTNLLSFVMENKIPITRENLLQAVKLLQTTPQTIQHEALLSIQKMVELKLPLTDSLFQSIVGIESKEGLHTGLDSLKSALLKDTSVATQTRSSIIEVLNQLEKPLSQATSHALLGHALKTLFSNEQLAEMRFSVLQLLRGSSILPSKTSLPNLQSTLAGLVAEKAGINQANHGALLPTQIESLVKLVSDMPSLSTEQKGRLLEIVNQIQHTGNKGMQQLASALIQMVGENLTANPISNASHYGQQILSIFDDAGQSNNEEKMLDLLRNAERSENAAVQKLVQLAESSVTSAVDGKAIKDAMQNNFRSLGFNYEALLLGKDVQTDRLLQSLKPQLQAIINDVNAASGIREIAEQLLVRMNGPALMSVENGVNHQLIMQLPLEFFGKKIDATLQWNGRMKDNKKIDADFARILFYLNLHSLQETVVDMQVQNRVVTITVFNDDSSLSSIGQPLQEKLKDGLESVGYKLSGVFYKGFTKDKTHSQPLKNKYAYEEGGLDIRI